MEGKKRVPRVKEIKYSQKIPWHIINPAGTFKNIANIIMLFLLMYTFTIMPYLVAFKDVEIGSNWFIADTIVDSLFFIDIIITFNTAIEIGKNDGFSKPKFVLDRRKIIMNYLKGSFVIDVISIWPFYLMDANDTGRSNVFVRFLRMARLSRIARATKIFGVFKYFTDSDTMESILAFLNRYQSVTRLFGTLFIVFLLSHLTACMWYFSARLDDFGPDTWVVRYGYQNEPDETLYLTSFYFAFTILTTVGYGDIVAYTTIEVIIAIFWMIFGVCVYSFVIGTLTAIFA